MNTFWISIFDPPLTRKTKNNQKTKTDVHNYNISSIEIHLIWFSSFSDHRGGVEIERSPRMRAIGVRCKNR